MECDRIAVFLYLEAPLVDEVCKKCGANQVRKVCHGTHNGVTFDQSEDSLLCCYQCHYLQSGPKEIPVEVAPLALGETAPQPVTDETGTTETVIDSTVVNP